jgi:nicotinamide phosphoribosyltransferase
MTTPLPITADAYTVSSNYFVSSKARARSVYNYTNRYSPQQAWPEVAYDSRMVLFGLSEYIDKHLSKPITKDDIHKTAQFMKTAHSFGGPLCFDEDMWYRVVDEYNGYLPIAIEALPEGSTFFPNEPVIQVTSLGSGFGEIAAHVEAVLVGMVSIASARATLCRHWLDRMRQHVDQDFGTGCRSEETDAIARFMIHDFGMRASSCAEEAELLGMAHLLSFHGTDTFNAAFRARQLGAKEPTGTSVLALAHRIVQGHDTELGAFEALMNVSKAGVPFGSYVSDCYNYDEALHKLATLAVKNPDCTFVARPDSGPYVKNVLDICERADEYGLADQNPDTGYFEPKNLKFINGDSMNPNKIDEVLNSMRSEGWAATKWGIFGVGGYLRNNCTRDSLSSAYKLASKGIGNEKVCKLSEVATKMSVPGPTSIVRDRNPSVNPTVFFGNHIDDAMKVYYYGGEIKDRESFATVQERNITDFDNWDHIAVRYPDLGLANHSLLSDEIRDFQQKTFDAHRKL